MALLRVRQIAKANHLTVAPAHRTAELPRARSGSAESAARHCSARADRPNYATVGDLVPLALKAVRKGGRVVCAGIHMSDIPSFPYRLLWEERQLCVGRQSHPTGWN